MTTREDTLEIHSYTPAAGDPYARSAVAANLAMRTNTPISMEHIFFTCGAAPALVSVLRALALENSEVIAITPYFPEYRPFCEYSGHKFVASSVILPYSKSHRRCQSCSEYGHR
jgi:aspartate aminotransferase